MRYICNKIAPKNKLPAHMRRPNLFEMYITANVKIQARVELRMENYF